MEQAPWAREQRGIALPGGYRFLPPIEIRDDSFEGDRPLCPRGCRGRAPDAGSRSSPSTREPRRIPRPSGSLTSPDAALQRCEGQRMPKGESAGTAADGQCFNSAAISAGVHTWIEPPLCFRLEMPSRSSESLGNHRLPMQNRMKVRRAAKLLLKFRGPPF